MDRCARPVARVGPRGRGEWTHHCYFGEAFSPLLFFVLRVGRTLREEGLLFVSPSSFPGMQAPASGLDRPHPACASEHVALSPRTPSCASTALGLLRHLQSHDDDPWLVGDALNGRGLVPTSSSPLRSQSHGDNAWPGADLDSLGSLPLSGSWTPRKSASRLCISWLRICGQPSHLCATGRVEFKAV